ncbi:MAG TPA: hypothetical protein GX010_01445 [Erysipelotrichaceae bacterium]|nr:hypothetical protein [Erysipelotrichaceae bacterium]
MKKSKFFMFFLSTVAISAASMKAIIANPVQAAGDYWIKITPNSKYICTIDGEGNVGEFTYNAGNNCNGLSLLVDLGMKADGVTPEEAQNYTISKLQIANLVNSTKVDVSTSLDGEQYHDLFSSTEFGEFKVYEFEATEMRFVKLTPTGAWQTFWGAEYPVAFYGHVTGEEPEEPPAATNDYIKIGPNTKKIYTVDGEGNEEAFAFNTGNNVNGKTLMIDLGKKADGTDDENQKYILAGIQVAAVQNVTKIIAEVSLDNENWTKVFETTEFAEFKTYNFDEVEARYVKMVFEGAWATLWGAEYGVAMYGRVASDDEPVEENNWLKIAPGTKKIYTIDSEGTEAAFVFNAGNNGNGLILMIDLGTNYDGTPSEDQCYILSGVQIANLVNATKVVIEVSVDGTKYTKVAESTEFAAFKVYNFGEINVRYVRITTEGQWQTFWGEEYAVAVYGRVGQLETSDDPEGILFANASSELQYALVKGDSIALGASKRNPSAAGDIVYSITENQNVATISTEGIITVNSVGDGRTVYVAKASVPNPSGGDYEATYSFVVLSEELTRMNKIYYNPDQYRYDLLDLIDISLVRASLSTKFTHSIDGISYQEADANKLLENPVRAAYVKVEEGDAVIYGVDKAGQAVVVNITTEDIDGFFPENPLTNAIDGNFSTPAVTPKNNLVGQGEVKGSVTLELDAVYSITAIRMFSFWNTVNSGFFSYSLDGVNFSADEPFTTKYCKYGVEAEFMVLFAPFDDVEARFVRFNITGWTTNEDSIGIREFNVYGEKNTGTVAITWNTEDSDSVTGMPTNDAQAPYGTLINEPETAPTREGYVFRGWFLDDGFRTAATFPVVALENVSLYAKWEAVPTHILTINVTGEGSVTGAQTGAYAEGTEITITVTASSGWHLVSVKVNDQTVTLTNNSYQLVISGNTSIEVLFGKDQTTQSSSSSKITSQPTSTSSQAERPAKSGCLGSVTSSIALVSVLGLVLTTLALSKKKED